MVNHYYPHLFVETQKQGGVAVLIDTETAVSREFLEAIGVDVSKLLYVSQIQLNKSLISLKLSLRRLDKQIKIN